LKYPLRGAELISKSKLEHLAELSRNIGIRNVQCSGMTKKE
jgi:hypothetical protein